MGPDHVFCMILGAAITLAIQYYGRRKVRLATVESIVTDRAHRLGHEIEQLRAG